MKKDLKLKMQLAEATARGFRLGYESGVEDGKFLSAGFQIRGIGFISPSANSTKPSKMFTDDGFLLPAGSGSFKINSKNK